AGNLNLVVTDNTGTPLKTVGPIAVAAGTGATVGGGATPTTIPINLSLPVGTGYRIYSTPTTNVTMIRENTNPGYPLPIGTVGNVTTSWTNGAASTANYYFFYNWVVSVGCEGSRVPVTATINAAPSGSGLATGGTTTGSNQSANSSMAYTDACNDTVA